MSIDLEVGVRASRNLKVGEIINVRTRVSCNPHLHSISHTPAPISYPQLVITSKPTLSAATAAALPPLNHTIARYLGVKKARGGCTIHWRMPWLLSPGFLVLYQLLK